MFNREKRKKLQDTVKLIDGILMKVFDYFLLRVNF